MDKMLHRKFSAALWMMVSFKQRTKSCPSSVGRFQHSSKNKPKQNTSNGVQMNETLLSMVAGNLQASGELQSLGPCRSGREEQSFPGLQGMRSI